MSETMFGTNPSAQGGKDASGLIKDTTTRDFMADVIEQSRKQPVLVDFWAPWCGPCKQLTPVLEKAVTDAGGTVKLVKLNIDEHPSIAGQMGIQSIPAVFAFKDGQPVDGFMGALPESQVKEFIERVGGKPGQDKIALALEAAQAAFVTGDHTDDARGFAGVLQADPQNEAAIAGLARCYVELGDIDHARQTLALASPAAAERAPVSGVRAALELAEQGNKAGDLAPLRAKVDADPNDFQARFDLAIALNAANDREAAIDQLLDIVKRKRDWNDEAARKQLVTFFEAWGPMDEHTLAGRRRLSSILVS